MAVSEYYDNIVNMLQGETPDLKAIPPERLDWNGLGAVLELYVRTSGKDRGEIIAAMGQIIEEGKDPVVVAQVIDIASSLDIAQVEPSIQVLKDMRIASVEPLSGAITNYLAFRHLR